METYTNETLKERINHAQSIDLTHSPIHKFILDSVAQHIRNLKDRYIKYLIDNKCTEIVDIDDSFMLDRFGDSYITTEFVGYKIDKYRADLDGAAYSTSYSIKYKREVLIEGTNVMIYIPLLEMVDKHDSSNTFKIFFKLKRVDAD